MKLNHFTDFSMRVLMYLNQQKTKQSSLDGLSDTFQISRNHLIKVVQFLALHQLIITKRGKNGGILIDKKATEIGLGDLIHLLEQEESPVINCDSKPCLFQSHQCKLKIIFNNAYQIFIESLNQFSLHDLTFDNWQEIVPKQQNEQNNIQ